MSYSTCPNNFYFLFLYCLFLYMLIIFMTLVSTQAIKLVILTAYDDQAVNLLHFNSCCCLKCVSSCNTMGQLVFSQCCYGILFLCDLIHFVSSATLVYLTNSHLSLMTQFKHSTLHTWFPETKTTTPRGVNHL